MTKPLTAAGVDRLKPLPNKRRIIKDAAAQSLFLVIMPSGHKSWMMRFRRPGGAIGKLVLGRVDLSGEIEDEPEIGMPLSLGAARQLAARIHRDRARGVDVIANHRAAKRSKLVEIEQSNGSAFAAVARQFIDEHARRHTRRWRETARFLGWHYPDEGEPTMIAGGLAQRWSARPIGEVDGHDLYGVIDETRRTGVPGLDRHRRKGLSDSMGRAMSATLSKMFGWLTQHRKIASNPALGLFRPPAAKPRARVLSDSEIKRFWKATDTLGGPFGAAFRVLLLTGQRLNEVAGMRHEELSDDLATWSIPGHRTKNRRPHRVPLAPMVREIITAVPRIDGSPYVFNSACRTPLSGFSKAKGKLDKAMGVPPWRLHDLRRSCVTGMAELGIRPDVIELAVNHASGSRGGIAGIYNRSELLPERRAALERWAQHVAGLIEGRTDNVTTLRRRRRP
jgi:integrase